MPRSRQFPSCCVVDQPFVDLGLQIGADAQPQDFLGGEDVRRHTVEKALVIAAAQGGPDPQELVDIFRCQLVLLKIALQLPVLFQLRLYCLQVLASLVALR